MKRFVSTAILLTAFAVPAFAAKNSQSLHFPADVTIGSTKVESGDYKITWTGDAAAAQVTLTRNGKSLVTFPAKVVEEKHSQPGVSTTNLNGSDVVKSIQLNSVNLVIDTTVAAGQ